MNLYEMERIAFEGKKCSRDKSDYDYSKDCGGPGSGWACLLEGERTWKKWLFNEKGVCKKRCSDTMNEWFPHECTDYGYEMCAHVPKYGIVGFGLYTGICVMEGEEEREEK